MLLRRTGRLSAAALGLAFKSPASLRAANAHWDWTLLFRKGHALQRHRFLCVSPAHLGNEPRDPRPVQGWDWPSGGAIALRGHPERVITVAAAGGHSRIATQPLVGVKRRHVGRGQPAGGVVFTPNGGVSSGTTQIRASSTAAKRSDGSKVEEENLKEASSAPEKAPMEPEPEGGKPNKTQQLKKVFKEYGAVGVSFHIGISLMSLGMFYALLSSGIDMTALLCKLGFSEAVVQSKMAAGTSTFVLAYAIHKLFAPVRISITLVSVPLIVRYLRKTGLFKPPTPAP